MKQHHTQSHKRGRFAGSGAAMTCFLQTGGWVRSNWRMHPQKSTRTWSWCWWHRVGVVSMCVGGGMGAAAVLESEIGMSAL